MSEIVIFGIGALFGAICVISWALCAADKKDGDDHMIEIIGEVGRPATEEEIKEFISRKDETHE